VKHAAVAFAALWTMFFTASGMVFGQTNGMGLNPSRTELEILPGQEKTTAFEIQSPPSDITVRGQLLLSLTDWDVNTNGTLSYTDPSTLPQSASSWVVFSPASVTIASGQTHLVRVTVRVPADTAPGVYRTAIFVQERPPAAPPKTGEHVVYLRLRYVFTLYVVVPPVQKHAEIVDVRIVPTEKETQILFGLNNLGTSHVRPLITASVRDMAKTEAERITVKNYEGMVLLPGKTLEQSVVVPPLSPGDYNVNVQVDFQDGKALQSVSRTVHINP
jgi:hypothetical protein